MLFLPVGYPDSTKENYLKYTMLAALAHFFMNTSATIGSTFLLYAAGLGRAEAQIAASAFNWIIKDLGGQGGTDPTSSVELLSVCLFTCSCFRYRATLCEHAAQAKAQCSQAGHVGVCANADSHPYAGTLLVGRMFSHDFDLNTRSWYCFANIIASLAAVVEVRGQANPRPDQA